jgi:hypothetical protein
MVDPGTALDNGNSQTSFSIEALVLGHIVSSELEAMV